MLRGGCRAILEYILFGFWTPVHSKDSVEEEMASLQESPFRRCQNIKSRKNPDVQCPYSAAQGDYCMRHFKNPRNFAATQAQTQAPSSPRPPARSEAAAAKRIQAIWRRYIPLRRFRTQGPAANTLVLANNDTELYSLDVIQHIPPIYRFSFSDSNKAIWLFDIRTLSHYVAKGVAQQNPYTRELLSVQASQKLHDRILWLRERKYQIRHVDSTESLTEEQAWNQKVLDVFLRIEALGYYVSCDWFHRMTLRNHISFYQHLYSLWEWRLGLTAAQKEEIVPGYSMGGTRRLFRFSPYENQGRERGWWEKQNLSLIDAFVSRSPQRESKKLGAMYVLMGFVLIANDIADAFPWIVEALP